MSDTSLNELLFNITDKYSIEDIINELNKIYGEKLIILKEDD